MGDYFQHWLEIGEREGAQLPAALLGELVPQGRGRQVPVARLRREQPGAQVGRRARARRGRRGRHADRPGSRPRRHRHHRPRHRRRRDGRPPVRRRRSRGGPSCPRSRSTTRASATPCRPRLPTSSTSSRSASLSSPRSAPIEASARPMASRARRPSRSSDGSSACAKMNATARSTASPIRAGISHPPFHTGSYALVSQRAVAQHADEDAGPPSRGPRPTPGVGADGRSFVVVVGDGPAGQLPQQDRERGRARRHGRPPGGTGGRPTPG